METKNKIRVPNARLILASSSPRRRELLAEAGYKFEVVDPPLPEPFEELAGLAPGAQSEALAYFKARAVADMHPDACILAADTVVIPPNGGVIGKPLDADHARRMLTTLAGTRHSVITAVAIIMPDRRRLIASDLTYVTMRPMSAQQIEAYIASGEWQDKAGGYAIQETADQYVELVEGSFSNVVGLPVELVRQMMEELCIHPDAHKAL